ncbi:hypothetical protein H696_03018 [Fonticula alba]|uniref:Ribosomal protein L28 n=1 Tax=Fonticula alba TaxID=691883 RepID=A0A058Z9Q8_FONAL|nr:hypothetical protein H696_03018 [Fonticula alba]KCV70663.1 hypothetical protein H696_03018 [Fonticula alba]|eukprot:XP_009495179.1 hypothetical protein H696_03018 [Fonticula alba]
MTTQRKRFFSFILNDFVRVPVTTHAMRCIDKAGGIDAYLLTSHPRKFEDSELAQSLRQRLIDQVGGSLEDAVQRARLTVKYGLDASYEAKPAVATTNRLLQQQRLGAGAFTGDLSSVLYHQVDPQKEDMISAAQLQAAEEMAASHAAARAEFFNASDSDSAEDEEIVDK